jgi:putative phage-type endonuclease
MTPELMQSRCGFVTASRIADIMAKTKNGESASRKNYMLQLVCERLTGNADESFTSNEMLRGIELEAVARSEYEVRNEIMVSQTGSIKHPAIEWFSATPDGLVGIDGLIEIKCPNTAQHVAFLLSGDIPSRYQWQMAAQMACTGRDWVDFASYDDRVPERIMLSVKRVHRDEKTEDEMVAEVRRFLAEVEDMTQKLRAL